MSALIAFCIVLFTLFALSRATKSVAGRVIVALASRLAAALLIGGIALSAIILVVLVCWTFLSFLAWTAAFAVIIGLCILLPLFGAGIFLAMIEDIRTSYRKVRYNIVAARTGRLVDRRNVGPALVSVRVPENGKVDPGFPVQ